MKKQIVIQIKETISVHVNINLHIIIWLGDNLSDDLDSFIEATHSTLFCRCRHSEHVIRLMDIPPLWLQRYRCKIPDCSKTFNNLTGSPVEKLHHKDK
ncbi:MAG: hypothetical protein ACTS73_09205 [Arsenophonus sp. NEOnobi-MAG3]